MGVDLLNRASQYLHLNGPDSWLSVDRMNQDATLVETEDPSKQRRELVVSKQRRVPRAEQRVPPVWFASNNRLDVVQCSLESGATRRVIP